VTTTHSGAAFANRVDQLVTNIERVIQGKHDVIRSVITCLLAEGHLLIEDVPGTGKTSLARALAASLEMTWNRIQFTPDLLPSDVTGVAVFNQVTNDFEFRPGAIFANVVIGDEINRASPKTQSALLEVMEEHTVTTDAVVYTVPRPFMVIATQNPIDMEGTYQLPEAQLDRFLMQIGVGYPEKEAEMMVLRTQRDFATVERLSPVMTISQLEEMIRHVKTIEVSPAIEEYVVALSAFTRTAAEVRLGVSPRGSLALLRAARARAAMSDRPFVSPDDVKATAPYVLAHRIILHPEAEMQGRTKSEMVTRALGSVPVPRSVLS